MPTQDFYKIDVKGEKSSPKSSADIFIYAPIGDSWFEETVSAKDFVKEIDALDVSQINVRINSIGGSVPDGIAIYNALKRHKAHITTYNDSLAASIASLILMAGDTVVMAENAQIMIHAPWTIAIGNSVEMRAAADMLDSWAFAMSSSYAAKSGQSKEEIMALFEDGKDHYYGAEEAIDAGYIDEVEAALSIAASLEDRETLSEKIRNQFFKPEKSTVAAATPNTKETQMPTKDKGTAAQNDTQSTVAVDINDKDSAAVLAADQSRRDSIAEKFEKFSGVEGVASLLDECQKDHSCTVENAGMKLLNLIGQDQQSVNGSHVVTVEDRADKLKAGVQAALLARAGYGSDDGANNYRGFTLSEMARASLEVKGINTAGMSKMQMVGAALTHTTSDFSNILSNVAEKSMMKGYEEAGETFQLFTSAGTLSDFKIAQRVALDDFPSLRKVKEGGEYKYVTVGDRAEPVVLATYGEKFSITRQSIINDDMDSFTRLPLSMGRAAIRTVGDLVYAILTSNPNMSDGTALFHADHSNLLAAAAISTTSVDAMRVLMGKHKRGGNVLNLRLANLIVPLALEGLAKTVRDSQYEVTASNRNNTTPNSVRNTFEVISDARLDEASASDWYGSANPAMHDVIEVNYLDGNQAPTLEQQAGWDVDGVEFKVRMDAGVSPLAFEGLAKNG